MRKGLWLTLTAALFLTLAANQAERSYWAERYGVTANVMKGGDLQVNEHAVFVFRGGPFAEIHRELPTDTVDGIVNIWARVDGQKLPEGDRPGQLEIVYGDPIRITWHMELTSDVTRTFDLYYRLLGAARREQNTDLVWWRPLPPSHDYNIASSQTLAQYSPLWPLAGQPSVVEGSALVKAESGRTSFFAHGLGPGESFIIAIPFQRGYLLDGPTEWQSLKPATILDHALQEFTAGSSEAKATERESSEMSGPLLGVGSGAAIWFWLSLVALAWGLYPLHKWRMPKARPDSAPLVMLRAPPADLPPALASALHSSSAVISWEQALGTLLDLAGRGFLAIDQLPISDLARRDYMIRLKTEPFDLRPHEERLLALVLNDRRGQRQDAVMLSALHGKISRLQWKRWARQVEAELILLGLLKPGRQAKRRRLRVISYILTWMAAATSLMFVLFFDIFGFWPLVLVLALAILAYKWLQASNGFSVLSDEGNRLADEWESFYRYLAQAGPIDEDEFGLYLPYAAAYGKLGSWSHRFKRSRWSEYPAYLRPPAGRYRFDLTTWAGKIGKAPYTFFGVVSY